MKNLDPGPKVSLKTITLFMLVWANPLLAVDGVIEINQAQALSGGVTAGDAPGFPITISQAGSYRLTGNLSYESAAQLTGQCDSPVNAGVCFIHILSNDVSLDLNGFSLNGDFSIDSGIIADGDNISIGNGFLKEFPVIGVWTGKSSRITGLQLVEAGMQKYSINSDGNCLIRDNIVTGSEHEGIFVRGDGCTITRNVVQDNSQGIVVTGNGCTISENTVLDSNSFAGISVTGGCTIRNNNISGNVVGIAALADLGGFNGSSVLGNTVKGSNNFGLLLAPDTGYANNVLTRNNGGSANPQVSGGVEIGINLCGENTTCP